MNPWCRLCERLVNLADADTACQEILQVFYRLRDDDDAWTAEVGFQLLTCIDRVAAAFTFVHPFPFYQNSPTLFPGRRS